MDREKYSELTDEAARARSASLPKSGSDLLLRNAANVELQRTQTALPIDPEAGTRAAAERRKQILLKLGERELVWRTALQRAAGGSAVAKALADRLVEDYERQVKIVVAEDGGTPGLRKLIEDIEAAQAENVTELTRIATAEAEEIRKAREQIEREEALRHAQGMSTSQAKAWLEGRGFKIRLNKKSQIEIAPAGNLTKRESAIVRLHYSGLKNLLQAAEEFVAIESVE